MIAWMLICWYGIEAPHSADVLKRERCLGRGVSAMVREHVVGSELVREVRTAN